MNAVSLKRMGLRALVASMMALLLTGCAKHACIALLEQAEAKYRDSLSFAEREAPVGKNESKWKTALSDFGQAQSLADESQRKYVSLKREDPDKNDLLRKDLEKENYFQRFSTVYSCSLRMQGIALANLGNEVYAEQKKNAGDLAAKEAEERYKYTITCGYRGM